VRILCVLMAGLGEGDVRIQPAHANHQTAALAGVLLIACTPINASSLTIVFDNSNEFAVVWNSQAL
jgi:hypothetical protein